MVPNRRCHPHLTNKPTLGALTDIYHQQAAAQYANAAEVASQQRIMRNVLDIFSRLLRQHRDGPTTMWEHSVVPLFVRVHERLLADASLLSTSSRRMIAEITQTIAPLVAGSAAAELRPDRRGAQRRRSNGSACAGTTAAEESLLRRSAEQRSSVRSADDRKSVLLESYV